MLSVMLVFVKWLPKPLNLDACNCVDLGDPRGLRDLVVVDAEERQVFCVL